MLRTFLEKQKTFSLLILKTLLSFFNHIIDLVFLLGLVMLNNMPEFVSLIFIIFTLTSFFADYKMDGLLLNIEKKMNNFFYILFSLISTSLFLIGLSFINFYTNLNSVYYYLFGFSFLISIFRYSYIRGYIRNLKNHMQYIKKYFSTGEIMETTEHLKKYKKENYLTGLIFGFIIFFNLIIMFTFYLSSVLNLNTEMPVMFYFILFLILKSIIQSKKEFIKKIILKKQ